MHNLGRWKPSWKLENEKATSERTHKVPCAAGPVNYKVCHVSNEV